MILKYCIKAVKKRDNKGIMKNTKTSYFDIKITIIYNKSNFFRALATRFKRITSAYYEAARKVSKYGVLLVLSFRIWTEYGDLLRKSQYSV